MFYLNPRPEIKCHNNPEQRQHWAVRRCNPNRGWIRGIRYRSHTRESRNGMAAATSC